MFNRVRLVIRMSKVGFEDSLRMGLDRFENWTPLLIYIHVTRLLVGMGLGFLMGLCVGGFVR